LGSRQEIIQQYGEGFWFVIKAHPPAHIAICAGGCNAEDGPKDKQDVELFLAEALKPNSKETKMAEKVLLIDDEKDFLDVMAERMRNRGMQVTTASSPLEALELVAKESFDAIILDLQMPEMDGLEALEKIKAKKPELQIILLTGHATVQKGVEAMKLGAMDLLEKPANLSDLTAKIKAASSQRMLLVEKKSEEKIRKILTTKAW
jgi:DNA-binding NtrC family response regulator